MGFGALKMSLIEGSSFIAKGTLETTEKGQPSPIFLASNIAT